MIIIITITIIQSKVVEGWWRQMSEMGNIRVLDVTVRYGSERENKHSGTEVLYLALGPLLTENLRLEEEVIISFWSFFFSNILILLIIILNCFWKRAAGSSMLGYSLGEYQESRLLCDDDD